MCERGTSTGQNDRGRDSMFLCAKCGHDEIRHWGPFCYEGFRKGADDQYRCSCKCDGFVAIEQASDDE